jgi:hypothetical protein
VKSLDQVLSLSRDILDWHSSTDEPAILSLLIVDILKLSVSMSTMAVYYKKGNQLVLTKQYRDGRIPTVYCKITLQTLAELFQVSYRTIHRWIKQERLDPYSLEDIINKFNNPHYLDKRRTASQ